MIDHAGHVRACALSLGRQGTSIILVSGPCVIDVHVYDTGTIAAVHVSGNNFITGTYSKTFDRRLSRSGGRVTTHEEHLEWLQAKAPGIQRMRMLCFGIRVAITMLMKARIRR